MNDNKRIAVNTVVIFFRLCIVTVVSICVSRLVLNALGVSDYGLYNVVGGLVIVLNVFNTAMVSTTYRYLSFEIGKKEASNPNMIFNTSFLIHICFALFILIFGFTLGLWYVDNYLNVAPEKIGDARYVLIISIITTAISTLCVPFQGLQVAYEKFTINAIIDIISQLIRLFGVLFFVKSNGDGIRMYAIVMLITSVSSGLLYYLYCAKQYYHVIKFNIYKNYVLIKEMLSFASWTLFGAVANIGKVQGSAIILNLFFGTVINAAYAVATQVESFILTFARTLNNAAVPQITKNYSGGNQERSIKLTAYISKYTFLLMCLVAFPVMLEMNFLLTIWLKKVPDGANVFCKLIILAALLSCLGEGIPAMINASGKIKGYQIIVNTFLLLGLPISYICYSAGTHYYTISIVYCAIFGVIGFIKIYMLHRVIQFNIYDFFKISYSKIILVSIPLTVYYFIYPDFGSSTENHICGLVISEIFLILVIVIFGLTNSERAKLKNTIVQKLKINH